MWLLEWMGWVELGEPKVEGDGDGEGRRRMVTKSHLEPPRQQCSAVYVPATSEWIQSKKFRGVCYNTQGFYHCSPEDANKNGLAEWHITLFGKEVLLRQPSGEKQ